MLESSKEVLEAEQRFLTGENFYVQHFLGVRKNESGYVFRVWAPHAQQVYLVGDFNDWDESFPMEKREKSGVWELATSLAEEGQLYKFLVQQANGRKIMKIDPFAVRFEERPGTAAVIYTIPEKNGMIIYGVLDKKRHKH